MKFKNKTTRPSHPPYGKRNINGEKEENEKKNDFHTALSV